MRRVYYEGRPKTDELFWFQDNRTGCEKQTVYFERIRQLDSELITKEQKHLVSAMERLKQLRYPRRKPVVLNKCWERSTKYQPQKSKREKSEARQQQGNISALVLNAKQMGIYVEYQNDRSNLREKTESPHRNIEYSKNDEKTLLNEQDTIELRYAANNLTDINKSNLRRMPIYDVFFPSLPCIPNVGHKTNIETENKLRILELANGEFQRCRLSNVSGKEKKKMRCDSKTARGRQVEYASHQSDNLTPILADVDATSLEKEFGKSSQDGNGQPQEIGKAETKTTNLKCEREQESSNVRQPPPPTRRNSQKSTSSFGVGVKSLTYDCMDTRENAESALNT